MTYADLIKIAFEAQEKAHAPYSNFRVGAAILTDQDVVITGCNIETSSLSLTICAERVALFKAISEGHRKFKAVAIVSDADDLCPPCGACRQVLWDIAGDIDVVMATSTIDLKTERLSQLLPHAFDDSYLHLTDNHGNEE